MDELKIKLKSIILQAVCEVFALDADVLVASRCRNRDYVDARHIASHCLQTHDFTVYEAADALRRSRVTMINSRQRYEDLYETDADFRRKADAVSRIVKERLEAAQKPMFSAQSVSASIIDPKTDKFYELGEVTPTRPQAQQPTQEDLMRTLKSRQQPLTNASSRI